MSVVILVCALGIKCSVWCFWSVWNTRLKPPHESQRLWLQYFFLILIKIGSFVSRKNKSDGPTYVHCSYNQFAWKKYYVKSTRPRIRTWRPRQRVGVFEFVLHIWSSIRFDRYMCCVLYNIHYTYIRCWVQCKRPHNYYNQFCTFPRFNATHYMTNATDNTKLNFNFETSQN